MGPTWFDIFSISLSCTNIKQIFQSVYSPYSVIWDAGKTIVFQRVRIMTSYRINRIKGKGSDKDKVVETRVGSRYFYHMGWRLV